MSDKQSQLHAMMQAVASCSLCCKDGGRIPEDKRLVNLIAQYPDAPHYGSIPTMYTDWATRLDAKLAIVLQDWGSAEWALSLKRHWEDLSRSMDRETAWRHIVRNRPEHLVSDTHRNTINFLKSSAELEGIRLPKDFLDYIFFTNAILCFKRGTSSDKGIDLRSSIENCCSTRKFLRDQLRIVRPTVVVALGKWALKALGFGVNEKTSSIIQEVRESSPHGYREVPYQGLSLSIVPAFHPVARPVQRTRDEQIDDYRFIWRALSNILGCSGQKLSQVCFGSKGN